MKDKQLDFKQEAIINYIVGYFTLHGYAPSYREVAKGTYMTLSAVHYHIGKLFDKGLLETDLENGSARAIRVVGYKFVKIKCI